MIRNGFVATAAAWAALFATGAAAQTSTAQRTRPACVSEAEAEAVTLALAPSLLRQVSDLCARNLPDTAFLRTEGRAMIGRYEAASREAMPAAGAAIARIIGPRAEALGNSEMLAPLMVGLIAPSIVGEVKPDSCPVIDQVLADLAPLPPANTASLLVTLVEFGAAKRKAQGKAFPFEFCPAAAQ